MHSRRILISVLVSIMGLALATTSSASPIIYCNNGCGADDEAAFNAAIAADSLYFPDGVQNFSTYSGTLTAGITDADGDTGLDFFTYINTTTTPVQKGVTISGSNLEQVASEGPNAAIEAALPGAIYAFAGTVTTVSGGATPYIEPDITASGFGSGNANTQVVITGSSDSEFFGVIDTAPITSVFIGPISGTSQLVLENFELGEQDAPTPEVATFLLIGTGLTLMGVLRRRRLRKPNSRLRVKLCPVPAAAL
jgi:hypothetical protein